MQLYIKEKKLNKHCHCLATVVSNANLVQVEVILTIVTNKLRGDDSDLDEYIRYFLITE